MGGRRRRRCLRARNGRIWPQLVLPVKLQPPTLQETEPINQPAVRRTVRLSSITENTTKSQNSVSAKSGAATAQGSIGRLSRSREHR